MIRIPNLSRRALWAMMAGGIALSIASIAAWWQWVYLNPYNAYWDMLNTSLQTSAVTRRLQQTNGQTKLDQTVYQRFGVTAAAQAQTTLHQGSATVVTETVGTTSQEFVRYLTLNTEKSQQSAQAKAVAKKTLNTWATADVSDNSGQLPLFEQSLFGLAGGNVVPMAQLSVANRERIMQKLHNEVIFDVDFSKLQRKHQDGRLVYVYPVKVQAVAYAGLQQELATMLGFSLFKDMDPLQYQGQAPTAVDFTIDAWSHQLVSVKYDDQQRIETYNGYGVQRTVALPKAAITGKELQQRVQSLE